MRWLYGYLTFCTIWGGILLRDLIPVLKQFHPVWPTWPVWQGFFGYIISVALLGVILPGKVQPGVPLADGTQLKYKCNGLLITGTVVTALAIAYWNGFIQGTWIVDNYTQLFMAANIYAFTLSFYLLIKGRLSRPRTWLYRPSLWRDFLLGAELNPKVFGLDIKFFSYRPSMCGWLLVNLSFLCKQYETMGFITSRMLLFQLTTAWYIWDYFVHETKMVSTWDIIAEHFGLMLVWGDYVFIVFAFSVQNFFLLSNQRPISIWESALIFMIFCAGFAIFRGTNSQKHQFKMDPKALIWGKPPLVIGGRLLASGFWGMARHMNYTGDLLLALSFCLPCGKTSSLAYLYFIYLLLLIVHREKRDDERCSRKYGSLWDEYCLHVPYRMLPFVY